jgi:hypothetical protein
MQSLGSAIVPELKTELIKAPLDHQSKRGFERKCGQSKWWRRTIALLVQPNNVSRSLAFLSLNPDNDKMKKGLP